MPGEEEETINHLLLQCRVSRELWELSSPQHPQDQQGRNLIQASVAVPPILSSEEAEAYALREAILQARRLDYHHVAFLGDCITFQAISRQHNMEETPLQNQLVKTLALML